jgi:hypothetical protein
MDSENIIIGIDFGLTYTGMYGEMTSERINVPE